MQYYCAIELAATRLAPIFAMRWVFVVGCYDGRVSSGVVMGVANATDTHYSDGDPCR